MLHQGAHTWQVLERQHAVRAVLPVHLGHLDPRGVTEVAAEAVGVLALIDVVNLVVQYL